MAAVTPDFNEIVKFAIELARDKAGPIIKEASKKRLQQLQSANNVLSEKKNSVDLVTETDQRVEEIIKKSIAERYPEHKFIGEESVSAAGTLPALTVSRSRCTLHRPARCDAQVRHLSRMNPHGSSTPSVSLPSLTLKSPYLQAV